MKTTTRRPPTTSGAIFQWQSLKTRVTIFMLAIFLVGIWSLAFYASYTLYNDMRQTLGEQQFSTVSIIAAEINTGLDDRMKALEQVAALITPAMLADVVTMQTFIEGRPTFSMMFNGGIFVLLYDGTAIADFPLSTGRRGLNFMDRKYAIGALKEGKTTIGSPVMGKALKSMLFSIAAPIHNTKGKVIGALTGTVDLAKPNFLSRITDKSYGKTGGYLLVAPKIRTIVFATDKKRIMEALPASGISPLIDRFIQGYEGSGVFVNPLGVEVLTSAKGIPVSGWYVAAQMPTTEAFTPVYALQKRVLLATIFLTLLAGGLTWWILKRQLAPIFTTIKRLAALAESDQPSQPLPIARQDEIGELIGGFNHLLETLEQRDENIRFHSEIMQNMVEGVYLIRFEDGKIVYTNPRFEKMFGYDPGEMIGKDVSIVNAPGEKVPEETKKTIVDILLESGEWHGEVENIKKDGIHFWSYANVSLFEHSQYGKVFVSVHTDITERKRAEEALRAGSERLKEAQRIGKLGFLDWDLSTDQIELSDQTLQIYGLDQENKKPKNEEFLKLVHPDDVNLVRKSLNDAIAGIAKLDLEHRLVRPDGEERYVHATAEVIRDPSGKPVRVLGTILDVTERKQAEEALQFSNERLVEAQKIARIGNWEADLSTDDLYWSQVIFDIFGFDSKSLKPSVKAFHAAVHPDDKDIVLESEKRSEQTGVHDVVHRIIRPNGEVRFVHELAKRYTDDKGKLVKLRGTVQDITEQKQAEEKLLIQNRTFQQVLNGLNAVVYVADMKTYEIVFINTYGQEILGDVTSKICWKAIQKDQNGPCQACTNSRLIGPDGNPTEGVAWEFQNTITKQWYDCRDKAIHWPDGRIVRMEIAIDITARKQMEEELRKSQEQLKEAHRLAHIGIWKWIADTDTVTWSEELYHIAGFDPMLPAPTYAEHPNIYAPESWDRLKVAVEKTLKTGTSYQLELELIRPDGAIRSVNAFGGAIYDNNGQFTGLHGTVQDITDRKQAEAEKASLEAQNLQLQKAESLARMAGAIAHTFNNQLGVVIGNLEMALDDLPKGSELVHSLIIAMRAANKAAEVSGQMLTYLGQSFDQRDLLDLSEACRRNLPILEASMPGIVALETDFPSPGPTVMANTIEIQQVLTNLITNAWEAVGTGRGSIHLSVKTVSKDDIHQSHRFPVGWQPQDSAYACIEISDTGNGIEDKDIEKIFDPFFTSKFTGRGLGLAMVLGIVKAHDGAITVASAPGAGSTFRVFFPVSVEEVSSQPEKAAPPSAMEGSGTILLVEDEEMVREMAIAMLTRLGFTVLAAQNGVEAVDIFRQRRDEIRLVLSDLTMPRMDGWETLTALRELSPGIPVILASGYDKAHVMAGDHPELPQVFLGKPYKLKELRDAIGQALVGSSGGEL